MRAPKRLLSATLAALTGAVSLTGLAHASTPAEQMTATSQNVARDLSFVLAAAGPSSMALGVLRSHGFTNPQLAPVRTDVAIAAGNGAAVHDGVVELVKVYAKQTVCLATVTLDTANRTAVAGPTTCMSRTAALKGTAAALSLDTARRLAAAMNVGASSTGSPVTPLIAFNAAKVEQLAAGKSPARGFAAGKGVERGKAGSISVARGTYVVKQRHRLATGTSVQCSTVITVGPAGAEVNDPAVKPPSCR